MPGHIDTLRAVIAAWERLDVEGVLAHLHDEIIWNNSGGIRRPVEGKEAMRKALLAMKGNIAESRWRLFDWAEKGDVVWMEGVDEFLRKDGILIVVPYAGVLEFEGPVIRRWREYFDGRLQEKMLAGEGVPATVEAMLDRPAA